MSIPTGYAKNVCRLGQGSACCRYLAADADGLCCAKVIADLKPILDLRVEQGTMVARGNNCPGWTDEPGWSVTS